MHARADPSPPGAFLAYYRSTPHLSPHPIYTPTIAHRSGRTARYAPGSQLTPLSHGVGPPRDPPSLRMTQYQKCVQHNCVIPRETYQDLYLVMRERNKHLVSERRESMDLLKRASEVYMLRHNVRVDRISGPRCISSFFRSSLLRGTEDHPLGNAAAAWGLLGIKIRTSGRSIHQRAITYTRQPTDAETASSNTFLSPTVATASTSEHVLPGITTYLQHTRAALHPQAFDPTQYATEDGPGVIPNLQSGTFLIGNHVNELRSMAASHRDPRARIRVSLYPKLCLVVGRAVCTHADYGFFRLNQLRQRVVCGV